MTLVVSSAVLALTYSATAQSIKPGVVTVVRVQGEVRYSPGDNTWHPLVAGKVLNAGVVIQSAANSTVDLVLSGKPVAMPQAAPVPNAIAPAADPNVRGLVSYTPMVEQNVVRMQGNTVLAIDKLTVSDTGADTIGDTELNLRSGEIFFNVKKMSATSQYTIKIPNGVAGIRGSSGGLNAGGGMEMNNGTGIISIIRNGIPVTSIVNAGFQFNPNNGSITPLSDELLRELNATVTTISTLYHQEFTSQAHDQTTVRAYIDIEPVVSPTTPPPPED
jgi:hypothetical protein